MKNKKKKRGVLVCSTECDYSSIQKNGSLSTTVIGGNGPVSTITIGKPSKVPIIGSPLPSTAVATTPSLIGKGSQDVGLNLGGLLGLVFSGLALVEISNVVLTSVASSQLIFVALFPLFPLDLLVAARDWHGHRKCCRPQINRWNRICLFPAHRISGGKRQDI